MVCGLCEAFFGTEVNQRRVEVSDEHLNVFVTDDIGDSGCHKDHLVGERFEIGVDHD